MNGDVRMSSDTDHREVSFQVTFTASPWVREGECINRRWSNPPPKMVTDNNIAAQVEKEGFWPFARHEWAVWSPFESDSVLEGSEGSAEAAMKAADEALLKLIAGMQS